MRPRTARSLQALRACHSSPLTMPATPCLDLCMATKYTATATDTSRTIARRGVEFPAKVVTCTCKACNGRSVLVPAPTVEATSTKLALHNYVAQAKVLGFPTI